MINYIIIDDEPIAHEIIEEYAENIDMLKLKKNCYNAFEALQYLNGTNKVDLMFLDINMPKLTGFEFLKSLSNPPKIIVTTAYKEFAVEGYELDITDYLLKPFSLPRFLKAVQKAVKTDYSFENTISTENTTLFLKDGKTHHQVEIKDILYIEALGNYTKVFTKNKVVVTLEKLATYLDKLSDVGFIQVHKSYIVAIRNIEHIMNNKIVIGEYVIPIGQTYKNNVNTLLNQ